MPPKRARHSIAHAHRSAPQRWRRGGQEESVVVGVNPTSSSSAADREPAAAAAAAAAAASAHEPPSSAAAASTSSSSAVGAVSSSRVPSSSLFTDYWHLESGVIEWRSEWRRQRALLDQIESHLLTANTEKKMKKKKRKSKKKKKKAAAQVKTEDGSADANGVIDLTAGDGGADVPASAASAAVSAPDAAVESSSSSSEEEPEVDIEDLLHFAHRSAYGPDAAPSALQRKGRSKRGKKRSIRDDEEETKTDQAQPERAEQDAHSADSIPPISSMSYSLAPDPADAESEEDPRDVELRSLGANLKGILTTFHASRRKHLSKIRAKRKREEKAHSRGSAKSHRSRRRDRDGLEFTPSPSRSPQPKRRRNARTHKVTMWKEESGKASAAASSAAAAASSSAAASIESRLAASPADFLCLGFLTLRQDGPVATDRLDADSVMRMAFRQRILPNGAVDPDEPVQAYFRAEEAPTPEARARAAAAAAEKRRAAKERRMQLEEEELQTGIPMDPKAYAMTDAPPPDEDQQMLSAPIVWHPSAVISTHHAHTIRIPTSNAAGTGESSSVPPAASATVTPSISAAVLESLFYLFSKQAVYLYPVHVARRHWFQVFVYLMPHAWVRATDDTGVAATRVENELTCAHLKTLLTWSCDGANGQAHNNNARATTHHFSPHALFEASRPPGLRPADEACEAFTTLDARLQTAGLKPRLRPYQKQALLWLLERERRPWRASRSSRFDVRMIADGDDDADRMEVDGEEETMRRRAEARAKERIQPEYMASWQSLHLPTVSHPFVGDTAASDDDVASHPLFFNEFTGVLSSVHPSSLETVDEVRGGVLAEEMGLGKTLEVAALMLMHPRATAEEEVRRRAPALANHETDAAIIPVLPTTRLPGLHHDHSAAPASAAASSVAVESSSASAASSVRRAPPLLVDPLMLSPKEYQFYQNRLAAASDTAAAAPTVDSDGEHEYGSAAGAPSASAAAAASLRERIKCYCGHDVAYFHSAADESLVECELCHTLQHALCMRVDATSTARAASHPFQASASAYPFSYLCPTCASLPTTPKLPVAATLIVCPDVIMAQWASEIARHVNQDESEPHLRVLIYKGVRAAAASEDSDDRSHRKSSSTSHDTDSDIDAAVPSDVDHSAFVLAAPSKTYSVFAATEEFISIRVEKSSPTEPTTAKSKSKPKAKSKPRSKPKKRSADEEDTPASAMPTALRFACIRPQQFAGYDVVLTTYSTLRTDLYHTASEGSAGRAHRYAKKYQVLPSPLVGVNWWRLCLDEAQMLGEGTTRCAEMALLLSSQLRWSVTGTPIYRSLEDLHGLLLFLGAMPYANRAAWRRLLAVPYERGVPAARARMHALVSRVMWRNTKSSVASQLGLPPTTYRVTRVAFTPIEKYYYEKRRDECRAASASLRQFGRAALTTPQMKKVLHALLRMRQACVHPQVGAAGGLVRVTKQTLSLADLSLQMLREARLQCEEIQRRTYFAIHGLAAIAIIKREYEAAVELYERVVGIDEQELLEACQQRLAEVDAAADADSTSLVKREPHEVRASPAVGGAHVRRREIAIDDLQKIHALHNLADALALSAGCQLDRIVGENAQNEGQASDKLEEEAAEEKSIDVSSSHVAETSSEPADPSAASSVALPLPPSPALLQRVRLLHELTTSLKSSYLSKQSQLVADAQAKFHSSNKAIFDHLAHTGGAGGSRASTWWLEALARLGSSPELEARFVTQLKRDLLAANESLVATEKAQPSIAESFRAATGLKYVLQRLGDELDTARGATSKRVGMQTMHQPPLASEVNTSAHCARCRVNQNGPPCVNCKSSSSLSDYEQKLYRFRFAQKSAYLVGAGAGATKQSKVNARLILPGEGRSRHEHATHALAVANSASDALLDPNAGLDEDEVRQMNNFMQQSEFEASLKALAKFMTDHAREFAPDVDEDAAYDRMLRRSKDHLAQLDLYKKELKCMFALNRVHREQLSLYDELDMSTSRIRLRFDGEVVLPAEKHFKLDPWEVDDTQMRFEADIVDCQVNMREWRGRLRFLEEQVQTANAHSSDGASTLCVICQEVDLASATEVAVLPCAHRLCVRCVMMMLERPAEYDPFLGGPQPTGRVKIIKCPQCRARTNKRDIAYVTNAKKDEGHVLGGAGEIVETAAAGPVEPAAAAPTSVVTTTDATAGGSATDDTDVPLPVYDVKGSWSSKIHSVLQCILHILSTDATSKILVFSEWLDVLTVIQHALRANSLSFLQIGGGSRGAASKRSMHESLAQFKSNHAIPLLLLPLNTAASGLNIVEAQHVVLVEPSLSAGKEAQAIGRIVRIGQTRATTVHRFIVAHSVEEKIFEINAHHRCKEAEAAERATHARDRSNANEHDDDDDDDEWQAGNTRPEDRLDASDFISLLDEGDDAKEAAAEEEQKESTRDKDIDMTAADEDVQAAHMEDADLLEALSASATEFELRSGTSNPTPSSSHPPAASTASSAARALHPNEHAFLTTLHSEQASLSSQHRFWTSEYVWFDDAARNGNGASAPRRINRLQALVLMQRQSYFDPASGASEAAPSSAAAAASPTETKLVDFQGRRLAPAIIDQLTRLPRAMD